MWQTVAQYSAAQAKSPAPKTPAPQPTPAPAAAAPAAQPALTPAVLHCWTAFQQTFALERGKGASEYNAEQKAKAAYRRAMPCLAGHSDIREFIACVTHGMVLEIIRVADGTRLLYAANVAAGALRTAAREARAAAQTTPAAKPEAA